MHFIGQMNEKIAMEIVEEIINTEHFEELTEIDTTLAMSVISLIEDALRMYHKKSVKEYFKEIDKNSLSKL